MNKKLMYKIGFVLVMSLMLTGCQSSNVQTAAPAQGVPYINGPTSAPGVKGPGQSFGANGSSSQENQQPQSMTEHINKTFTLN